MTDSPAFVFEAVAAAEFERLAHDAGRAVPVEQAQVWEAYDSAVAGRRPWGRVVARDSSGTPRALIALTRFEGRGFTYLWAKHGPVWLLPEGEHPSPADEAAFHAGLRAHVAATDGAIAFVRLHAHHRTGDLKPLLQSVTYDETVEVDLTLGEDGMMAAMGKTGRKKLRRTLRDEGFALSEERGISREGFDELYEVYAETARRDGFGIYPASVYYALLTSLGDAARLWVARRTDAPGTPGRPVSWVISTFYDGVGQDYYGGSNTEGLETNAALRLKWFILTSLSAEGGQRYDMMGVGSALSPQLMGVRQFKLQFADNTTPVDASWDLPVKPLLYRGLTLALAAKRAVDTLRGGRR